MRLRHLVVGCAVCALGVAPAAAQWINHPTPTGLRLMSQSDTQFVFHALGGSVRFVPDAKGIATQMILTIVEGDIPVMRKP